MPAANSYELDFAKALINGEKLGQNGVTDLLVVSLSANDIQGHQFGPDSGLRRADDSLARPRSGQFRHLARQDRRSQITSGSRSPPTTASRPFPPTPPNWVSTPQPSTSTGSTQDLNARLNARYSKEQQLQYLMPGPDLPYIVLDRRTFEKAGIDEKTAEEVVTQLLPEVVAAQTPRVDEPLPVQHRLSPTPQFAAAYTRLDLAHGQLPPSEWGRLLAHSYTEHGNWYVFLALGAYQMEDFHGAIGTTHFSPWSYDRHVPLAFYGAPFLPGEYHERVAPVDLAVTLASLAGINQPSASVGRVLTEAFKPMKQIDAQ